MKGCPRCGASGTLSVHRAFEANPLGSFSLAGAQMKMSAREVAVAQCSACNLSVRGHLEDVTVGEDGRTVTGGRFVAGGQP